MSQEENKKLKAISELLQNTFDYSNDMPTEKEFKDGCDATAEKIIQLCDKFDTGLHVVQEELWNEAKKLLGIASYIVPKDTDIFNELKKWRNEY